MGEDVALVGLRGQDDEDQYPGKVKEERIQLRLGWRIGFVIEVEDEPERVGAGIEPHSDLGYDPREALQDRQRVYKTDDEGDEPCKGSCGIVKGETEWSLKDIGANSFSDLCYKINKSFEFQIPKNLLFPPILP